MSVWNIFLLCLFLLAACRQQKKEYEIDLEFAYSSRSQLMLSEFVEHLEYVVLETKGNPIDRDLKVYTSEKYLICIAFRQIYLFDRQTGHFIREIGKFGRGPGEYLATRYFDSNTQFVYASGNGLNLLEYDLNGRVIRSILLPQKEIVTQREGDFFSDQWILTNNIFLDKNTIVYYNENLVGDAKDRLLIVGENGNVINIFANSNSFIQQNLSFTFGGSSLFYHHNGDTFFFENCVDTIYRVTKDKLIPHFNLRMGRYKPPYEKKGLLPLPRENPLRTQYFIFNNIGESYRFLFFNFFHQTNPMNPRYSFFGFYDKKSGKTKIADVNKIHGQIIVNDIDNFLNVQFPSWTINEHNEIISYIEAFDIVEWFETNPEKARNLPEHLQKLSKIQPEDNPVVVIATLKQ